MYDFNNALLGRTSVQFGRNFDRICSSGGPLSDSEVETRIPILYKYYKEKHVVAVVAASYNGSG